MVAKANVEQPNKIIALPALMSKDEIKADQDVIRKNLTALDQQIHNNAVQCLLHCEKHRDTSLMVRLLTEIIDGDTTGYRRQGLIAWMKYYTPMRLKGKTIDMSGKIEDKAHPGKFIEQPFNIEDAFNTPFWKLVREGPSVLRPFYQQGMIGGINRSIKQFEDAWSNTDKDGKPIDPAKPFYKGKHADTLLTLATEFKKLMAVVPPDSTQDVDKAQQKQRQEAAGARPAELATAH